MRHGTGGIQHLRDGAVPIVWETGKPIAQVAKDIGIDEGSGGGHRRTQISEPCDADRRPSRPGRFRHTMNRTGSPPPRGAPDVNNKQEGAVPVDLQPR